MNIEEAFTVAADPATTWGLIRDPACMMTCVPGCQAIERIDQDRYRAEVGVGVGPIRARFNLLVTVLEERPPTLVRSTTEGEEGSRASLVKSNNEVRLSPVEGGGTEIAYRAEVTISGRLGRYGSGMMTKIAGRLAKEFEETFRQKAEAARELVS